MLCFLILFRSVKYGLLALIPSIVPIIIAGGIMKILNIYLDVSTMMIAAVTFGIAVDDTIHVMLHFIQGRKKGLSTAEALHMAISESGRAVVFTSIILVCGFSMLLFSAYIPNIYYGFFGGIIILMALAGDLLLLPAVIFGLSRKTEHQALPVDVAMPKS